MQRANLKKKKKNLQVIAMRALILGSLLGLIVITMMLGASQASDNPTVINLMIDAELPPSATEEQAAIAEKNLEDIFDQIRMRGLVATVFATQDAVISEIGLDITRIGHSSKFELAMSGNHSGEKIGTMSYEDQLASLKLSKVYVESCKVCGQNEVTVYGFMPQSFDQNEQTYKALDTIGILYNTGFQAGLMYAPGHEDDVWPYLAEGYKFYAVPVSTYTLSDKKVVLQDSYFEENGLDANQWYDALVGKFDEIQGKDEPLVISLTTSLSGSGEYLDALNKFMDYAKSKNAAFITTMDLVNLAKSGVHDVSSLPTNTSEPCPTCGQGENSTIKINTLIENPKEAPCETCGNKSNDAQISVSSSNTQEAPASGAIPA